MGLDPRFWLLLCSVVLAPFAAMAETGKDQPVPGFVSVNSEGETFFYFTDALPTGQTIFVQMPTVHHKLRCCDRVEASELKPVEQAPDQVIKVGSNEVHKYALQRKLTGDFGEDGFVGIAMSAGKIVADGAYATKAHTGRAVTRARLCYGTEGLNLIARRNGKVHVLYMSFGGTVDVQPQCTKADTRDIGRVSD